MTASAPWRQIAGVAVAGSVRWLAARLLRPAPPGGRDRWTRANHAGRPVTLLEGPEYVLGATAGSLLSGSGAGAVVVVAAGVVGALDDVAGDASSRGLRGHLAALRRGQVTTGVLKVVGLGVTGTVAAALTDAGQRHSLAERPLCPLNRLAGVAVAAGVVAGTANLVNLLDLRPGRALKVTSMIAAPLALAGSPAAPAALGSALASLGDDLKGVSMLGDTGANAAGALLGVALLEQLGRRGRLAALGVLTALTLASEKVSFTRVIESTPVLRELDGWGRAPMAGEGLG